jgi:hypothetical protein
LFCRSRSDDGVVRLWHNFHEKKKETLASAFVAHQNLNSSQSPGLIIDWKQSAGRLVSGIVFGIPRCITSKRQDDGGDAGHSEDSVAGVTAVTVMTAMAACR